MKLGVLLLNFGEPEQPTLEHVVPFLERIFATNAVLEGSATPEQRLARSRQLAEQRAPGLIAEYEEIGGSPLNEQARAQAAALEAELRRRGHDASAYVGMQFSDPLISDALARAREDGVDLLVGLPVYPLAGPSTTVAALQQLRADLNELRWEVGCREIGGWHRHPHFTAMWADEIRQVLRGNGLALSDPQTRLVFSAHGTPLKYIREGSRYDEYVKEACASVATAVGAPSYVIGYQNHTNRPVEWTQPDIEAVIDELDAEHVVVVPISFMHEQSETLAELDHELKEEAEERGLGFHRVAVPHADSRLAGLLADLVEATVTDTREALRACACRPGALCTNGT